MQTLLKMLTQQRGQTFRRFGADYARAAQEVAARLGDPRIATSEVQEVTFRRWTGGHLKTLPNQPAADILEHMYGYTVHELLSEYDARAFTQFPPAPLLNESDIAMTARHAAAHAGETASHVLPDMTLDQLDDDMATLARAFNSTSPIDVFGRARELLNVAQSMADRTQVPRQRCRAFLAAGRAAALLSAISFDLGSLGPAVQLARTSALYGQVTENGPLQAYSHGVLAFLAYWDGRPSEAVRHITAAQQYGGLGDTARVRLSVIAGRSYGHQGDHAKAKQSIRASQEHDSGDRDELHDDIGGEFGFPDERVAMSNATTYLLLQDADGAETAAQHALDILQGRPEAQRPTLVTVQATTDLARARLLHRDLDGAQEALNPAFRTPTEWRSAGMLERMNAARAQLTHPDFRNAPAAASLAEQIEDFSATAAARSLGSESPLAIGR